MPKTTSKLAAERKAPKNSQEMMLSRVEAVRIEQRAAGHFDCFGRAAEGYCDQGWCMYYDECLSVSRLIHSV